jgi:hypothetical protein
MEGKYLHEVELIVDGGNRGMGSFGLGEWLGRAFATATSVGWADGWWCSHGGWCLFQLLAACFPFVRSDCGANKVVVGWARCLRFGWDAFCCLLLGDGGLVARRLWWCIRFVWDQGRLPGFVGDWWFGWNS